MSAVTIAVTPEASCTVTVAPAWAVPETVTGVVDCGPATVKVPPATGLWITSGEAATTEMARVTAADVRPPTTCVTLTV